MRLRRNDEPRDDVAAMQRRWDDGSVSMSDSTHRKKIGLVAVRRFLFIAAVAFWLGGFTFYSAVVIHIGIRMLGSHLRQGLVTQRVTDWLNLAGAIALLIMLWNMAAIWRARGRILRFLLCSTWLVMAAILVELVLLHPLLDRLLDTTQRQILDSEKFGRLHHIYLMSSIVQWVAGLIHIWSAVAGEWM